MLLLSAREALLARLILAGAADADEEASFKVAAFGRRGARECDPVRIREAALDMLQVRQAPCWHPAVHGPWGPNQAALPPLAAVATLSEFGCPDTPPNALPPMCRPGTGASALPC